MPPRPKPKARARAANPSSSSASTSNDTQNSYSSTSKHSTLNPPPFSATAIQDSDDEEDTFETGFFNRRRQFTQKKKSSSNSKSKLTKKSGSSPIVVDDSDESASPSSSSDEESSASQASSSSNKGRKRKRSGAQKDLLPAWTRETHDITSVSSKRRSREPSANAGTSTSKIGAKMHDVVTIDDSSDENGEADKTAGSKEREGSFTPPPPLEQYILLNARNFLKTTLAQSKPSARLEDLESTEKTSTEEMIKLNPELALLYKGPEAAKVRELALAEQKERNEKKRLEKEKRRAEFAKSQSQKTGDTGADSDGSIDFQGSPISSSRRGNGEARALSLEDELSSPEIHPPSRTASTSVAPEDPSLAADDGPRVSLNLRAKGGLSWTALARPTTVMSKLVAGFLDAQKDQVKLTPAERAKCRIEFEGDTLPATSTVEDNELEDDYQLDVKW